MGARKCRRVGVVHAQQARPGRESQQLPPLPGGTHTRCTAMIACCQAPCFHESLDTLPPGTPHPTLAATADYTERPRCASPNTGGHGEVRVPAQGRVDAPAAHVPHEDHNRQRVELCTAVGLVRSRAEGIAGGHEGNRQTNTHTGPGRQPPRRQLRHWQSRWRHAVT